MSLEVRVRGCRGDGTHRGGGDVLLEMPEVSHNVTRRIQSRHICLHHVVRFDVSRFIKRDRCRLREPDIRVGSHFNEKPVYRQIRSLFVVARKCDAAEFSLPEFFDLFYFRVVEDCNFPAC